MPFTITFAGTDTPFNEHGNTPYLYAVVRRENGVGCQPTYGQDQQVAGSDAATVVYDQYTANNPVPDGSFSIPITFTPVTGSYIVCAWLETDNGDHSGKNDVASEVVTASASGSYLGFAPKPACVVPKYNGDTLKTAEAKLKSDHCGIGRVTYTRSHHVRRGHVIKLSGAPGHRYTYGTKIGISVSRG